MITERHALDALRHLSEPEVWENRSPLSGLKKIGTWATYAPEAIQRNDIQAAKACIAVISRLSKTRSVAAASAATERGGRNKIIK